MSFALCFKPQRVVNAIPYFAIRNTAHKAKEIEDMNPIELIVLILSIPGAIASLLDISKTVRRSRRKKRILALFQSEVLGYCPSHFRVFKIALQIEEPVFSPATHG